MSLRTPSARALPSLCLGLFLAGCESLLPVTAPPIPEQPNYGQLPGPGTYAVRPDPSLEAAPPETLDADTDGQREGLLAPRTGADTLAERPMPAPQAEAVAPALARALEQRGYRARPEEKAAWHVHYHARVEDRDEIPAPRDKALVPRMRCDLNGCQVQQQWEHFGPPLRGPNLRQYQVGVVHVQVRNAQNGEVVWQGRLSSELEDGAWDHAGLDNAVRRLLGELPRAPRRNPLQEPADPDAAQQAGN